MFFRQFYRKLDAILSQGTKLMSALDDLTAAIGTLTTSVTAGTAEIKALADAVVAAHGADNTAALEQAATQIKALAAGIDSAVTAANTATTPPPPPPAP